MFHIRYDCIIIGTGPAGLEAALNLKIREKSFLLLGNSNLSTKLNKAPLIHNYLGLPAITGENMTQAFHTHLSQMEITITEEMVSVIYPMGEYFALATQHNTYEATTVILAPGVLNTRSFPGEDEFLGKGVGYCATCDAPLYKDKIVAIIGYSDSAAREANFVVNLASKLYYIPVGKTEGTLDPRIEVIEDRVQSIVGEGTANTLVLRTQELAVDGIFILRNSITPTSLFPGLAVEDKFIKVDRNMQTNFPGCFAAGDCTGEPHQYIRAAGQGLTAAHSVVNYLATKNR